MFAKQDNQLPTFECSHACHAFPTANERWVLSVDEGYATVRCGVCRCRFDGLGDGIELLYSEEDLPVRLTYLPAHPDWHGCSGCNCGGTFSVRPREVGTDG